MKVYPFNQIYGDMGTSSQSEYIYRYLTKLEAKTVVVESDYIDKDYLLDYSYYYARSFESHDRFAKRLHIFSETVSEEDFKKIFEFDEEIQKKIEKHYLGFVVVKPIRDPNQRDAPFIGRTILKTYPKYDGYESRYFVTNTYSVSLYGFPLTIKSLPYQTQDNMVSKCATAAIWVSLHALNALFGTETYSPFEITQTSVSFPGLERNFPSTGLSIFQMKDYFNSIGMDSEFINVENAPIDVRKQIVADAVKAHLKLGLPVIACIRIKKKNNYNKHAVVISGYRYDNNGNLKELYVHDDQIGPYSKVTPKNNDGDFSYWKNEWITKYNYEEIFVEGLFIPIYPKIRLSFNHIYDTFLAAKKTEHDLELFLTELKVYKKFLLGKSFYDKTNILTNKFPRFLWVIRNRNKKMDILLDAISLKLDRFCVIDFD